MQLSANLIKVKFAYIWQLSQLSRDILIKFER